MRVTAWFCALLSLPLLAAAADQREACVRVINLTPKTIVEVHVVHKYSTEYTDTDSWARIAPGETSRAMIVRYNTGFMTTGMDWWHFGWTNLNETIVYFSQPGNRMWKLLDWVEGKVEYIVTGTGLTTAGIVGNLANWAAGFAAGVVGSSIVRWIANTMATHGGITDFHAHTLRSRDRERCVRIMIKDHGILSIVSISDQTDVPYIGVDRTEKMTEEKNNGRRAMTFGIMR